MDKEKRAKRAIIVWTVIAAVLFLMGYLAGNSMETPFDAGLVICISMGSAAVSLWFGLRSYDHILSGRKEEYKGVMELALLNRQETRDESE